MGFEPSPPQLFKLASEYCINHLETISTSDGRLKPGIKLPAEICQTLFDATDKEHEDFEVKYVPLFEDTKATRLRHIKLRGSKITSAGLVKLLRHRPYTLNIHQCGRLTSECLQYINKYSANLTTLHIGTTTQIFPPISAHSLDGTITPLAMDLISNGGVIKAKNLQQFSLHMYTAETEIWNSLLVSWPILTHLDLSGCDGLGDLSCLQPAVNLVWLCLYNVAIEPNGWEVMYSLTKLRHLDVSTSTEISSLYSNSSEILGNLIKCMPHLTSLDISGTNLAGRGVATATTTVDCDIPGLESRVNRPLEFLGLYGAHHEASHRHSIPAKRITGDKNEEQILAACQAYLDRAELLEKILNDLFHLHRAIALRADEGAQSESSLRLILEAMNRHLGEKHVQISGSASLFYIIRNGDKTKINSVLRRQILGTLIKSMEIHIQDSTMMRNACLTICLFSVPQDVLFAYRTLVSILLQILSGESQDEFVERISIYLLNSLACQVDGSEKVLVGEMGAIEKMLRLITSRLARRECDDVMEIAWSTMWNVTDETEENCRRFLEGSGMSLFLDCLRAFPEKAELLRNMMGLLGNVAECGNLRPQLMNSDFIQVFTTLLSSTQDNIEVSYNAAGVLSHILSDGYDTWSVNLLRNDVVRRLQKAILRWDVNCTRNINYRSFHPILRLLTVDIQVCQLWASWALANLTTVYPTKYCELLEREKGLELLSPLLQSTCPHVKKYASIAFQNVKNGLASGDFWANKEGDDEDDSTAS